MYDTSGVLAPYSGWDARVTDSLLKADGTSVAAPGDSVFFWRRKVADVASSRDGKGGDDLDIMKPPVLVSNFANSGLPAVDCASPGLQVGIMLGMMPIVGVTIFVVGGLGKPNVYEGGIINHEYGYSIKSLGLRAENAPGRPGLSLRCFGPSHTLYDAPLPPRVVIGLHITRSAPNGETPRPWVP